jgi:hypothetical protein
MWLQNIDSKDFTYKFFEINILRISWRAMRRAAVTAALSDVYSFYYSGLSEINSGKLSTGLSPVFVGVARFCTAAGA